MKNFLNVLKEVALFKGIMDEEMSALLACLAAKTVHYEKGSSVLLSGEYVSSFGVILSGQVQIVSEDYYGNRNIITKIEAGGLFGESFACSEIKTLPVAVMAATEIDIMYISCDKLAAPCTKACDFHVKLIRNMLNIVSLKNIALTRKMEITSKRTTREKLLAYLSMEAKRAKSNSFTIPFNRQELADYLFVERSAMSAELSKLSHDGIIAYNKNRFELLMPEA